jgi:hypothetical protein
MPSVTRSPGSTKTNHRPQFSILTILFVTTLIAVAIANPGFALFMPFAVGMLLLVALLIIVVGFVQFLLADDRSLVLAYIWSNMKWVIAAIAFAIAYFCYAVWSLNDGLWPN